MWDPSGQPSASVTDLFGDYNPFGSKSTSTATSMDRRANTPPTVHAETVIPLGSTQPAKPQNATAVSTAELEVYTIHVRQPVHLPSGKDKLIVEKIITLLKHTRQEELERKAQELEKREEELRNSASLNSQRKNWPPLPGKFCVQPCFYQDINVEIKVEFQTIVRMLYYVWLLHALLYVLNVGGCLALFIEFGEGTMFGLSILYCCLFVPASYLFWFRPVYKAFKSDSSFNFLVFFVFFFAQLIATVIQAIGFPNLGTCGFIVGLAAIGGHTTSGELAVGIIVLILASCFGLIAFGDFLLLVRVSRLYRSTGGSLSKARSEFTSGVMKNEHVQNATTEVITSAVRAQMSTVVS